MTASSKTMYFFIDESGDPTFYNKKGQLIVGQEGCSNILILGFIKTTNPKQIRKLLNNLKQEIANDEYLADIPSIKKSVISFHAKDDSPEVREKVYKLIKTLDFKAQFIVARKKEEIFSKRHKKSESTFYNEIASRLLENKMHQHNNVIYFAKRGNKNRQIPLEDAVQTAIINFESKNNTKIETDTRVYIQVPTDEKCLEVIDYMNWAVQRAFNTGDMRYYNFVKDKISFVCDIYDFGKYPNNFYSKANPFDINKISPLSLGSKERTA